ncbi:hypothetical protein [Hufsiella ginkgonis]|uniref:Uncharacterized protein n=1 Tax=Hufsiella ginkgonis TaxID=2695274 RepID=A0A7K1Y3J7_9SPHI|nr:hypothetical protein [Hufsiella ginkgonis]MXV17619.1 hypothetical protein [Hufsiella ginkgonis]
MKIKHFFAIVFISVLFSGQPEAKAQCAMCTLTADNSVQNGNMDGRGLNKAILYLLAAPYVAVGIIGTVWYRKYRRRNIALEIKDERINLN